MMNDPIDLRALADVESPEVVRSALRSFRRRALRTILAVLLAGALAGAIVVAVRRDPFALDRQIASAPGVDLSAGFRSGDVTLALVRVADLQRETGFRFLVIAPAIEGLEPYVDIDVRGLGQGKETRSDGSLLNVWTTFEVPADGRFEIALIQRPKCVDEKSLGGGVFTCARFATRATTAPGGDPSGDLEVARFRIDLRALGVPERYWLKGGGR